MIDLCTQTCVAHTGVNIICKVERRCPQRQSLNLPSRSKYKYLRSKQIHLHRIQKINCIWVRISQNLLNSFQPFFKLIILFYLSFFILPVSRKSFLSNVIHSSASDLYLNPFAVWPHHRKVQRLITIRFWMTHPVPYPVRAKFINICYSRIYVPALLLLVHPGEHFKNNTYRKQIIYFAKLNILSLHLFPDRVNRLDSRPHLILNVHLVKFHHNRFCKVFINLRSLRCSFLYLFYQLLVSFRMFMFKTKLFKLSFYCKQAKTMSKRRIYI